MCVDVVKLFLYSRPIFRFIKFHSTLLAIESCFSREQKLYRMEIENEHFCGLSIINAICSFVDEKFQCWKFVCHNGKLGEGEERVREKGEWGELKTVNFMHPHVLSHWAIVESWTKTIKSILFKTLPSSPPSHHFRGEICVPCDVKCGWTWTEGDGGEKSEIFLPVSKQQHGFG